jgi:hypothetical protein
MSTSSPPKHRRTFESVTTAAIDWRLVAPATRSVLDRLSTMGHGTIWSGRALVTTAVCSSLGGALVVLGGVSLLHR